MKTDVVYIYELYLLCFFRPLMKPGSETPPPLVCLLQIHTSTVSLFICTPCVAILYSPLRKTAIVWKLRSRFMKETQTLLTIISLYYCIQPSIYIRSDLRRKNRQRVSVAPLAIYLMTLSSVVADLRQWPFARCVLSCHLCHYSLTFLRFLLLYLQDL